MAMRRDIVGELRRRLHAAGRPSVLVAVSGGPDSIALAHAFYRLAKAHKSLRWQIATVNHGLRSDAGRETALVHALAETWGVACETLTLAPPERFDAGMLAWAREARYAALETARTRAALDVIATAHHADDQIETLLMRLVRGASSASLAGMRERRGALWRPLLRVSRADIMRYVDKHALPYAQDPTNTDTAHLRARVRLWLRPLLDEIAGFAAGPHLLHASEDLRADEDFLHALAGEALSRAAAAGERRLSTTWLGQLPPALRRRVLWLWLSQHGAGPPALQRAHLDGIEALLSTQGHGDKPAPGRRPAGMHLGGGLVATLKAGALEIIGIPTTRSTFAARDDEDS